MGLFVPQQLWPGFSISSGLGEVERVEGVGLGIGLCQWTLSKTDSVGKIVAR